MNASTIKQSTPISVPFTDSQAQMRAPLDISVPLEFGEEPDFEKGIGTLKRLREEFGVRRVFITGCPGLGVRITGWSDDLAPYERFGDMLARVREAVTDTGLEVGWWNAPTVSIAKNGPFQFMVGRDGKEALHTPCPLDESFVEAFCLRIGIVAGRARPAAILFEDDLHFNGQRDKTNDGWTGPCCYCPLHLAEFARRCGRTFTRKELVAATEGDSAQARELRRLFAEMLSDNMLDFGRRIREAVDAVSPETEMGMCGSGDIFRNNGTAIKYARAIAGPGRPFIRIPASVYDSDGSMVSMVNGLTYTLRNVALCPHDIRRIVEVDTYPHNPFYMPASMVSALMAITTAIGAEGMLFYGAQYLDDPLEYDGYFRVLRRENAKLATLRDTVRDLRLAGVRLVGPQIGLVPFTARYGWPATPVGEGPALLDGHAAGALGDEELRALLEAGGVVLDGPAAACATARGFGALIGAEVRPCDPPPAFREQILPAAGDLRVAGRRVYNMSFAAPSPAEKCEFFSVDNPLPGVEPLVEYRDPAGRSAGTAVYRFAAPSGARIGVVATTLSWNLSASLFSLRKREVLSELLEWTARREIPVRVADEANVMLLASASDDGNAMVTTVVNLRSDLIDGLDLFFASHWMDASVEELASDGAWRKISAQRTSPRIRRLDGLFAPGISRVFKFVTQP